MNKTNPLSVSIIKQYANDFRAKYGIKPDEAFPISKVLWLLEDEGKFGIQIVDSDSDMMDADTPAVYNSKDNFIYLKENVLEDLENENYRANFTLAHELFHYIQLKELLFTIEEVEECKAYEDIEWQANEFAGQLLCPSEYMIGSTDEEISNLAKKFKVSEVCIMTRLLKKKRRNSKAIEKAIKEKESIENE